MVSSTVLAIFFACLQQCMVSVLSLSIPTRYSTNITVDCKDLDKMDHSALVMTSYGDRSNSRPLTVDEVQNDLCPKIRQATGIIKAYSKTCFKPFPRQIIGLLVRGNKQQIKKLCDSNEEMEQFSRHSNCFNTLDPELVHKCMDKYTLRVESIRDNLHDLDLKLPYSCCSFWDFKQCVRTELSKCSEEAASYADDNISKASQESLDLTCKNYEEFTGNCQSLPKLQMNRKRTHISYLPALVDIFTNL